MAQTLKEIVLSGKEFDSNGLNIQNYSLIEVSKSRAMSEKFKSGAGFDFDPEHLAEVISNKGKVYAYMKKGSVDALYVVRKNDDDLICDECYYSPEISGEPVTDLMDQQVAFLIAERVRYTNGAKAFFRDLELPKLIRKSGAYNWGMAISFALLYSVMFTTSLHRPLGVFPGLCMGLAMGFCFQKATYHYETDAETAKAD